MWETSCEDRKWINLQSSNNGNKSKWKTLLQWHSNYFNFHIAYFQQKLYCFKTFTSLTEKWQQNKNFEDDQARVLKWILDFIVTTTIYIFHKMYELPS
jgi:hypothetical protein